MNIALVSREFPPFYGGGIGTYTEQAAHALAADGHRVLVLTVSRDGSTSRSPHDRDPRVVVVRVPLVIGDDWSRLAPTIDTPQNRAAFTQLGPWSVFSRQVAEALPALAREFELDVIEAPECGAILWWTLNERRLGRSQLAKPEGPEPLLVVQLHSPNEWVDEHNRQAPPVRASIELRQAERDSARMADLVISPSRDLGAWARSRWGLDRVEPVPYPLGLIRVEPQPRAVTVDGALRGLLVGRMEPRKGVDLLIAAVAIAARRGLDVRVELAGQDTRDWRTGAWCARRAIATLLPLELASRVTVLGKLDAAALADARARASICVAPGVVDNFPYAVVESMATGMPVIAPSVGGMSELVRDGVEGHIFHPHDPVSLADALAAHAALTPDARARMAGAAAARVASFCSNQRAVSTRHMVFASAIAAKAATTPAHPVEHDVTIVGGSAPSLTRIVRLGAADCAIGWEEAPGGGVVARSTPDRVSCCLGPPIRGPVAIRTDLLRSMQAAHAGSPELSLDTDAVVNWLCGQDARAVVDPTCICPVTSSSSQSFPGSDHSPHSLDPATFERIAPLRMARRSHPFPWDIVPKGS